MVKGRFFEKEIEKVIEYVEKLGFHGHKNNPYRLADGTYIKGENFDYEIFLPQRHDCFDAKQCTTDTWHILKKDIKQGLPPMAEALVFLLQMLTAYRAGSCSS